MATLADGFKELASELKSITRVGLSETPRPHGQLPCGCAEWLPNVGTVLDHDCCVCWDARYVAAVRGVRPGHPDFGRHAPCPTCAGERGTHDEEMFRQRAGIPRLFSGFRFANFDRQHNSAARDACARFSVSWPPNPPLLVLTGGTGRGKTHLATAIMYDAWTRHGAQSRFVVAADLINRLRAASSPNAEQPVDQVRQLYRQAPLLVLDDLGTEYSTNFAESELFGILDHRYREALPSIITTNHPADSMDERLASRLRDKTQSRVAVMQGPDRRVS